ncbi:hypothetical protein M5585_29445 [Serratia ureilytica]
MSTYVEYKLNLLQRQNAVGAGADDIVETGIMYRSDPIPAGGRSPAGLLCEFPLASYSLV